MSLNSILFSALGAVILALGLGLYYYKSSFESEQQLNIQYAQATQIASDEALKDVNKTQIIVKEIIKRYEPQKQAVKEFKLDVNETNQSAANRLISNFDF